MADLDKDAAELTTKATFRAARDAASKAIDDALLTDEERAQRKAVEVADAKRKRSKTIAIGVVGLLLVLGIIGLVVSYWQWFLLAGLVGLGALYARYRWRKRRGEKKLRVSDASSATRSAPPRKAVSPPARVAPAPEPMTQKDEQSIEEELAALKARVKK